MAAWRTWLADSVLRWLKHVVTGRMAIAVGFVLRRGRSRRCTGLVSPVAAHLRNLLSLFLGLAARHELAHLLGAGGHAFSTPTAPTCSLDDLGGGVDAGRLQLYTTISDTAAKVVPSTWPSPSPSVVRDLQFFTCCTAARRGKPSAMPQDRPLLRASPWVVGGAVLYRRGMMKITIHITIPIHKKARRNRIL